MVKLSSLTPAEIKFIRHPNESLMSNALKVTFRDLMVKRVLEIKEDDKSIIQVFRGKDWGKYDLKPHEQLFTNPFETSPDMYLTMYEVKKLIKEEVKNAKQFKREYLFNQLSEYFKPEPSFFLFRWFSKFRLNPDGEYLQSQIGYKILAANNVLAADYVPESSLDEIYKEFGTNILLLDNEYIEDLKAKLGPSIDVKKKKSTSEDGVYEQSYASPDWQMDPALQTIVVLEMLNMGDDVADVATSHFDSGFDAIDSSGRTQVGLEDHSILEAAVHQ
jgi:hypothetical protein